MDLVRGGSETAVSARWPSAPAYRSRTLGRLAQTINGSSALSFGSFVAGTGWDAICQQGAPHANGRRGAHRAGSGRRHRTVEVSGTSNATYWVTLPADGTVVLSDGSHTMNLNSVISTPAGTGTLSASGKQVIRIGASQWRAMPSLPVVTRAFHGHRQLLNHPARDAAQRLRPGRRLLRREIGKNQSATLFTSRPR